ncbi:MAG TPA: hypothetical protein VF622_09045, partial [Segetibacter sp.]
MSLYQTQPFTFNLRFDLITWNLMQTGLHQWLLVNQFAFILFDIVFYSMPLIYWFASRVNSKARTVVAGIMLIVNWIYIQCYTLYPTYSIESYTVWLLFPLLFITPNLRSFYFLLHGLRYFFLFFFASAGIWKLVQYGAFNTEQMSGVLLFQHKEFLTSSPGTWYSSFIYWLINHSLFSYLLYLAGTIIELAFIVGFFTRKYDRWLIGGFLLFLCFNVIIMRIHYWEMTPFLLTLIFSKYALPDAR